MQNRFAETQIAVIGLGYVGLPLAVEFGKQIPTLGFDINSQRVNELRQHIDNTQEVEAADLQAAQHLEFCDQEADLKTANVYIITVPTPIDNAHQPDLTPLKQASELLGRVIDAGDTAIFESTVYPGATEEICAPIIEQGSGLRLNQDFTLGYSPERINPGDKQRRLTNIVKVTSGSTPAAADFIDALYAVIVDAGTHKASSIRVAEAAKVIENTQRDINIALINELALIFNRLGIDTEEVLQAAGTKWNFLPFRPGLVGGHCISVDPYYLTHKAQSIGYHPEVILAGRRINDRMGQYVADQVIKLMTQQKIQVVDSKILVMGLTFKENCPDIRNTRVIDIVRELQGVHARVDIYDPWVDPQQAQRNYGLSITDEPEINSYDAIIVAVNHRQFSELGETGIRRFGRDAHILFDVKYTLDKAASDGRL